MKIKLKKKINWLNILLIILITALLILFFIAETKEEYKGAYKIYTVVPGDTIYNIAKDLKTSENLNKLIYQIRQDNNITDCGNLKIGQEIKIREVWD